MALSAGFHRLTRKYDEVNQRRERILFWLIYTMDRALALNLGRAPNIQDYDIQTDRLSYPEDIDGPMGYLHSKWIDMSELQGQVYLQLYSVQAQKQSVQAKTEVARQLAARCLIIRDAICFVSDSTTCP